MEGIGVYFIKSYICSFSHKKKAYHYDKPFLLGIIYNYCFATAKFCTNSFPSASRKRIMYLPSFRLFTLIAL